MRVSRVVVFAFGLATAAGCPSPSPNLIVESVMAPPRVVPGEDLSGRVQVIIANGGTGPALRPAEPRYYYDEVLSVDESIPDIPATLASSYRDDSLLPGGRGSIEETIDAGARSTLIAPTGPRIFADTPNGRYFLCVRVDSDHVVSESDEGDNVRCQPIQVGTLTSLCVDFEGAAPGANAGDLYAESGVHFSSQPQIQDHSSFGFRSLVQGDPSALQPARSCRALEVRFDAGLDARRVTFDALGVGLISAPVHVTAVAYGHANGEEVELARDELTSQSRPGHVRPWESMGLQVAPSQPTIRRMTVEYGTCPPLVTIDNLCIRSE